MNQPAMSAHILIVEDEPEIRAMLRLALTKHQHTVTEAKSAEEARTCLDDSSIELALVDWMLPGVSGIELVRSLRKQNAFKQLPIIMVTARTDDDQITAGLDAGADDYVSKPFSPRELLSRIQAVLRRSQKPAAEEVLVHGPLRVDVLAHQVFADGNNIDAGHTEFKLLTFFMRNPNRVYSRSQILDHVWGTDTFIEERTVDVHILRLRKLLKPANLDSLIETVRGAGYRLTPVRPPHGSDHL